MTTIMIIEIISLMGMPRKLYPGAVGVAVGVAVVDIGNTTVLLVTSFLPCEFYNSFGRLRLFQVNKREPKKRAIVSLS